MTECLDTVMVSGPCSHLRGLSVVTAEGEHGEDGGWLVGTSELQLQLQDSNKMHPVRIDNLPHNTLFSVLVSPLQYCSKEVCDVESVKEVECVLCHCYRRTSATWRTACLWR